MLENKRTREGNLTDLTHLRFCCWKTYKCFPEYVWRIVNGQQLPATVSISGHACFRLLISPYNLAQNLADNADLLLSDKILYKAIFFNFNLFTSFCCIDHSILFYWYELFIPDTAFCSFSLSAGTNVWVLSTILNVLVPSLISLINQVEINAQLKNWSLYHWIIG